MDLVFYDIKKNKLLIINDDHYDYPDRINVFTESDRRSYDTIDLTSMFVNDSYEFIGFL